MRKPALQNGNSHPLELPNQPVSHGNYDRFELKLTPDIKEAIPSIESEAKRKSSESHPFKTTRSSWHILFALFISATIIETVFLFVILPARYHVNDNDNYWGFYRPVAANILAGKGLQGPDGKIAELYPPGYPIVLASAFAAADYMHVDRNRWLDIMNILITAIGSLFIFLTARDIFGATIGFLSWCLWASYLPYLWTLVRPNSETPFMPLLYCGVWLFFRTMKKASPPTGFIAGIVLGFAALIRPIGLFLPLALAVSAFFFTETARKKRVLIASLILAGFVISVAPWETYLITRTRSFVLLSTDGPPSMNDGLTFALEPGPNGERVKAPAGVIGLMERAKARKHEMQTIPSVLRFVSQEATGHPLAFAELLVMKLYRPWYGMATHRHERPLLGMQLIYLSFGVAGLILAIRKYQEQVVPIRVLVIVVVYFWGMAFLVLPIARYMVPPFAYITPFVAIVLHSIAALLSSSRKAVDERIQSPEPDGIVV